MIQLARVELPDQMTPTQVELVQGFLGIEITGVWDVNTVQAWADYRTRLEGWEAALIVAPDSWVAVFNEMV